MEKEITQVAFTYLSKDNQVLLLQEGGRLAKGLWSFPGGHVDAGESFEEAAIREAMEESGYKVELEKIIHKSLITNTEYKGSMDDNKTVEIVIFKGKILSGKMKIDNQALDLKWFDKDEAIKLKHRWDFLKDLIINN
jgi:8-oxo-dGTP diphosphatase